MSNSGKRTSNKISYSKMSALQRNFTTDFFRRLESGDIKDPATQYESEFSKLLNENGWNYESYRKSMKYSNRYWLNKRRKELEEEIRNSQ